MHFSSGNSARWVRVPLISSALLILLVASSVARADRWIPYTDGRVGGCFQTDSGRLFGCTPQPSQRRQDPDDDAIFRERKVPPSAEDARARGLERENRSLRAELERSRAMQRSQAAQAYAAAYARKRQREQEFMRAQQERDRQWRKERDCRGAYYEDLLRKQGLKRHPTAHGVCMPVGAKQGGGNITIQGCPPC